MSNTKFWLLRAITNQHVGSGDADFGIVDKHVQRDAITGLPTINASSIKGAFREALSSKLSHENVEKIFGSENPSTKKAKSKEANDNVVQGSYRFFSAKILALPIRSSENFFYIATCLELLEDLVRDAEVFGITLDETLIKAIKNLSAGNKPTQGAPHHFGGSAKILLEDWESSKQDGDGGLASLFGNRVAILHASDFKQLSEELPIIARNHLENGTSVNLWYEQVVPRETRFYCPIVASDDQLKNALTTIMRSQLQIGGNATVGYGLTHFSQI